MRQFQGGGPLADFFAQWKKQTLSLSPFLYTLSCSQHNHMSFYNLSKQKKRQQSNWLAGCVVPDCCGLPPPPPLPLEPPESLIAALCWECTVLASHLQQATMSLNVAHEAIIWSIGSSIISELQPTYSLSPPDLQFSCILNFYNTFTRHWDPYTPAHSCCGYDFYCCCTSLHLFLPCLPGWDLCCKFSSALSAAPLSYQPMCMCGCRPRPRW